MTKPMLVWLLAIFFLATTSVKARPQEKVPRIGFLSTAARSSLSPRLEAFRPGLQELGYVEGKNIAVEYRSAEGNINRRPELAARTPPLERDPRRRRQLEITLKFSRRAAFRIPQTAGLHDNLRHPHRNKSALSLGCRAQEYCIDFRSERGKGSMEKFISHAAILGGAVQDCRPAFAPVCPIMDRSCSGKIIYSRLCWHQCCVFAQRRIPTIDTPGLS